ncbi:MAG: 6-phosphogluconolactonase, partial [Phycisphaerae bacterium]|nr:6-phosphogluconolactonase [Phycisphaerae bacterium]
MSHPHESTLPSPVRPCSPLERIPVQVHRSSADASRAVAHAIAALIRARNAAGSRAVLGLATGSTPHAVYEELVRLHQHEGLSFRNVTTFNLDEYWPMQPDDVQSYRRFMREYLFDRVDLDPAHTHVPDGTVPRESIAASCDAYEAAIRESGGIDLQILG